MSNQKHQEGDHGGGHHDHTEHHRMMIRDFQRRFYVTLVLTLPVLALSPLIQQFLGFTFGIPGDGGLVFALATVVVAINARLLRVKKEELDEATA